MAERRCAVCGDPVFGAPAKVYCSPTCRKAKRNALVRERGYNPKPTAIRQCANCGVDFDFHPKMRVKFCSRACVHAARPGPSVARFTRIYYVDCGWCSRVFVARMPQQKFCSRPCSWRYGNHQGRRFFDCQVCGVTVDMGQLGGKKLKTYCSPACAKKAQRRQPSRKAGKERRSARKRGARTAVLVYRKRIFERDGFRCQLCGKRLDMKKVAPHPLSPTLDHIIPLSKGGAHEPANVQAAHFLCNARKSDGASPNGDQLRLIG